MCKLKCEKENNFGVFAVIGISKKSSTFAADLKNHL